MRSAETRYAKTADGVHIAHQTVGSGPTDLVFLPGWVFNIEQVWEWPQMAAFARRLASFSRLILFDRRGTGLSDHIVSSHGLTLEARMDDLRAVMDDAGSERATLIGFEQAFAVCSLFAATYPERTAALIGLAVEGGRSTPEAPWRQSDDELDQYLANAERGWGTIEFATQEGAYVWPSIPEDDAWWQQYATFMRRSVSPGDAVALLRIDYDTDVGDILPTIRVPTLVIHRSGDHPAAEEGRFVARSIPGARLIELPGSTHGYAAPDQEEVLEQIERFVRGLRREQAVLDRTLATILFTDIVGSTKKASELGDRAWRELLEAHHRLVRGLLARYRGREIQTAGDGFFASFEGPARAIRCAQGIVEAVPALGIEVRAGVHTGEVETIDDEIGGIAVNIGARVGALAGPSEVLVSQTVRDLVAGSGILFEDAGEHELRGVPERWRLYRAGSIGHSLLDPGSDRQARSPE
jgi:class 3 adenylate cyclase